MSNRENCAECVRDALRRLAVLVLVDQILADPARWVSLGLYIVVALMWLVPDRRIEALHRDGSTTL